MYREELDINKKGYTAENKSFDWPRLYYRQILLYAWQNSWEILVSNNFGQ